MHTVANTISDGIDRVLNDVRPRLTSGVIEGVNSMVQAARTRARGYRNPQTLMTTIDLIAGDLDFQLPVVTHSKSRRVRENRESANR